MDYEDIFNEIGQFGKWQRSVFAMACFCSMACSFLTLGYSSFIGFTPKFRCFIPQCDPDNRLDANYDSNYTDFAIPGWGCSKDSACFQDSQCKIYSYIGTESICSPEFFDNTTNGICDVHVYDKSEYEKSLIVELDLAPSCESQTDGWPLEVINDKIIGRNKRSNNFKQYGST